MQNETLFNITTNANPDGIVNIRWAKLICANFAKGPFTKDVRPNDGFSDPPPPPPPPSARASFVNGPLASANFAN
jgi:hypothetical protein